MSPPGGPTGSGEAEFIVLKWLLCGRSRMGELEQWMPLIQLTSMGCIVPIFVGPVVGMAASAEARFEREVLGQ